MSDHAEQIEELAKKSADAFLDDIKDRLREGADTDRVKDLLKEIALIKADAVQADDEKALFEELLDTKLGTLAHVLDEQRIIAERAAISATIRALRSFLAGFGVVVKEFVKVSLRSAVTGAVAGFAGDAVASKIMDAATPKAEKLVDDGVRRADEELGDLEERQR